MKIEPKTRGFICTTAHPIGCDENVRKQIQYVKEHGKITNPHAPKKVLIIGSSTGYGLASRIALAFGCRAATIGVAFEKPAVNGKTASAGWYNTAAFDQYATADGLYASAIMGDAFSDEIKEKAIATIREDFGKIDMLVYSLAAPRRTCGNTVYSSTLKPIGASYTNKSIDLKNNSVISVTMEPATELEIESTVKVMGGEDWNDWVNALKKADVLSDSFTTIAYSYIGPALTHAIYRDGTIGMAKKHLEETAKKMTTATCKAYVSINKALVTQSSAAIPVVPLYISILFQLMKKRGTHENCIAQMVRLFHDKMYGTDHVLVDENNRPRVDDWEMEPSLQEEISKIWDTITTETLQEYGDIAMYQKEFLQLFGFAVDSVDYEQDVEADVAISHLK